MERHPNYINALRFGNLSEWRFEEGGRENADICMYCGKTYDRDPELFCCPECADEDNDGFAACENCGCIFDIDTEMQCYQENIYCDKCYQELLIEKHLNG